MNKKSPLAIVALIAAIISVVSTVVCIPLSVVILKYKAFMFLAVLSMLGAIGGGFFAALFGVIDLASSDYVNKYNKKYKIMTVASLVTGCAVCLGFLFLMVVGSMM